MTSWAIKLTNQIPKPYEGDVIISGGALLLVTITDPETGAYDLQKAYAPAEWEQVERKPDQ